MVEKSSKIPQQHQQNFTFPCTTLFKDFNRILTILKLRSTNRIEIKRWTFLTIYYFSGAGSSIGCLINFHNIFALLASYIPLSFVVSTSLLIYVVLYKNELLSNLYVLIIKVLCFATSSFHRFSSSLSKPQNTRTIYPWLYHDLLFRTVFDLVG